MIFFFIAGLIYSCVNLLAWLFRWLIEHSTEENPATIFLTPNYNIALLAGALFSADVICRGLSFWWAVPFIIYLLFSALMDAQTQQVYDLVQCAAIAWQLVAFIRLTLSSRSPPFFLISMAGYAAFLLIQQWQRCYGLADTLAFVACGLFVSNVVLCTGNSISLFEALIYLLALANGLFLISNFGNFSRGLKLKQQVAFIPAIALATMLLANVLV